MSLRVLHIVPVTPDGGTSGFIDRQIMRLREAGVEGHVFPCGGVALLRTPFRVPSVVRAIRREIRTLQPDLVHAHWGSILGLIAAMATLAGPPLVISYRGSDLNPVPTENWFLATMRILLSQAAALRAAAIICMSDGLRQRLWWRRVRASVIPDGTDLALFSPAPKASARLALKWPPDVPIVLFSAGLNPAVKRLDLAEAAIVEARRSLPSLRFEIMRGDVPYNDVPLWLNASDCLLMTSDFEGSPNIVREALACHTPVVAVPVGDVVRWIDGVDGTQLVEREPATIGRAIVAVIKAGVRPDFRCAAFNEASSRDAILDVYWRITRRP